MDTIRRYTYEPSQYFYTLSLACFTVTGHHASYRFSTRSVSFFLSLNIQFAVRDPFISSTTLFTIFWARTPNLWPQTDCTGNTPKHIQSPWLGSSDPCRRPARSIAAFEFFLSLPPFGCRCSSGTGFFSISCYLLNLFRLSMLPSLYCLDQALDLVGCEQTLWGALVAGQVKRSREEVVALLCPISYAVPRCFDLTRVVHALCYTFLKGLGTCPVRPVSLPFSPGEAPSPLQTVFICFHYNV